MTLPEKAPKMTTNATAAGSVVANVQRKKQRNEDTSVTAQ